MKKHLKILTSLAVFIYAITSLQAAGKEKVLIFAAASAIEAVNELIAEYKKTSKTEFAASYAGSGTLAKQIVDGGAEANIFISADTCSMETLEKADKIEKGTKFLFGKNSLVLVASPKAAAPINKPDDLIQALGAGKLAMGDPNYVPAGRYAADALKYYKIYNILNNNKKLALYSDVRQALNSVEMAQADYGIVYKTDTGRLKKAGIAYTFDAKSHAPIEYPACVIAGKNTPDTKAFIKFMQSRKGKEIIKQYGF